MTLLSLHLLELEQLMLNTGLFVFEDARTKDILWQKCGIINAKFQAGFKWLPPLQGERRNPRKAWEQQLSSYCSELGCNIFLSQQSQYWHFIRGGTSSTQQALRETIFNIRHKHAAAKWSWLKHWIPNSLQVCFGNWSAFIVLQGK